MEEDAEVFVEEEEVVSVATVINLEDRVATTTQLYMNIIFLSPNVSAAYWTSTFTSTSPLICILWVHAIV